MKLEEELKIVKKQLSKLSLGQKLPAKLFLITDRGAEKDYFVDIHDSNSFRPTFRLYSDIKFNCDRFSNTEIEIKNVIYKYVTNIQEEELILKTKQINNKGNFEYKLLSVSKNYDETVSKSKFLDLIVKNTSKIGFYFILKGDPNEFNKIIERLLGAGAEFPVYTPGFTQPDSLRRFKDMQQNKYAIGNFDGELSPKAEKQKFSRLFGHNNAEIDGYTYYNKFKIRFREGFNCIPEGISKKNYPKEMQKQNFNLFVKQTAQDALKFLDVVYGK